MTKEKEQPPTPLAFDQVIRMAKEMLLRDGYHTHTVIVDGSRQRLIAQFSELAPTHDGRVNQMFVAGAILADKGSAGRLRRVFFISEGWMSVPHEGHLPDVPPSQDPNRKEVLVITGYEPGARQTSIALFEMVRDTEGRLTELKEFQPAAGEGTVNESPLLTAFVAGFDRGRGGTLHKN